MKTFGTYLALFVILTVAIPAMGSTAGFTVPYSAAGVANRELRITQITMESYDAEWSNYARWIVDYDSTGNIASVMLQLWDNVAETFVNDYRAEYTFRPDGMPLQALFYSETTGIQTPFQIHNYEYTGSRLDRVSLSLIYGEPNNSSWEKLYGYDPQTGQLQSIIYNYYDQDLNRTDTEKLELNLDSSGRPVQIFHYDRSEAEEWLPVRRDSLVWLPQDQSTLADFLKFNALEWAQVYTPLDWGTGFKIISNTTAVRSGNVWRDTNRRDYFYAPDLSLTEAREFAFNVNGSWQITAGNDYTSDAQGNLTGKMIYAMQGGLMTPQCRFGMEYSEIVGVNDPENTPQILVVQAYPNPFSGSVRISAKLGTSDPAKLEIFDARGRKLRSAEIPGSPNGAVGYAWDGKDNSGNDLGSGIYYLRVRSRQESTTLKLLRFK